VRDDAERLRDILDAIYQIERYLGAGRDEFDASELVQVWVVHHLQIIGEAARGLSRALRSGHPEVPWSDVIAFRNLVVHEYFGIDLQEVWDTALHDLPPLKKQVENMLRAPSGSKAAAEPWRTGLAMEPPRTDFGEGVGKVRLDRAAARGQSALQSSTAESMRKALQVVVVASEGFRRQGFFERGVLNRLNQWIACLPRDHRGFVSAVVQKAAATDTGAGADINGVALDEQSMPSLESLVLHYAEQDPDLFKGLENLIEQTRAKLAPHSGPKYLGPWP